MASPETPPQPISVQSIYFNGFQLSLSNADVTGLLMLNNVPSVALSMSYTTAKTLKVALEDIIATLETVTDRKIMTTTEVSEGLEKLGQKETGDANVH